MAYKFQQDAAQLSGSVTINAGNNLLFQLDGRTDIGTASKQASDIFTQVVTASVSLSGTAVRANYLYGNGENITGISSDTVDIKATVGTGSQPILNVPSVASDQSITGSTLFTWDNGESHLLLGATTGKTPSLTIGSGHAQDGLIVFDGSSLDWCMGYDATAENFEIGTDSSLGSQPVFTIAADGSGAFTFTGSAPSLTIGGGDEVDTKVVFDGVVDFYIGLDDTDDKLHIGLGSAVGTTPNITLNSADRDVSFAGDVTVLGGKITLTNGSTVDSESAGTLLLTEDIVKTSGDLTVGGGDIKAGDGTTALTLVDSTGNVTVAGDLKITGEGIQDAAGNERISLADAMILKDSAAATVITIHATDLSTTFAGDVTIGGTTPTLTIGDGGAEDAAIVFDGNAEDFHIGLDDTADTLVFGYGSALGTTTAMTIDEYQGVTFGGAINYVVSSSTATTHGFSGSLPNMLIVNAASAATIKLPNTTITDLGLETGYKVVVKRSAAMANDVTITGSTTTDKIDAETEGIVLETAGAAVGLLYDGTEWHII